MEKELLNDGSEYRKMVLVALGKQSGTPVGALLSCEYTHAKNDYEFFMWTGSHPIGPKLHTLLASTTTQERLDSHWQGFVANQGQKPDEAVASPDCALQQ